MITSLNNFAGVTLETDVTVITLKDNLTHSYCSRLSWEKDNAMPMGVAKLTMPYSQSIEQYWSTYSDTVIIHANLNSRQKASTITPKTSTSKITSKKTDDNKIRLQNDEYNYSFIGKVHKFKQVGKEFVIYLEDLGWKFLQKVPPEFRKTYIAGQKLDDAFQAICEFMGVDFAYSLEGLNKYNFAADGYSVEKDGQIIEDTPSILEEFNKSNEETEENPEKTQDEEMGSVLQNSQDFEAPGLIEYEKNKKKATTEKTKNTSDKALNQLTTNQTNDITNTTPIPNEEESTKKEEYEKEFEEKIKDLFKGNTLYDSNVSDPVLNYDWITIQPTATTTSNTSSSTTPLTNGSTPNTSNNQDSSSNSNQSNKSTSNNNSSSGVKGVWGKTAKGSFYLTQDAINKMSMAEAKRRYEDGKKRNIYTKATMEKLFWRMMFGTKFF